MDTLNKILKLIKERCESDQEFIKAIGAKDKNLVLNWRNGVTKSYKKYIVDIAKAFDVSVKYLSEDTYPATKDIISNISTPLDDNFAIPILGVIRAGEPMLAIQNIEGYINISYTPKEEYFCLKVVGDSMNGAQIFDKSLVIVHSQPCIENGEVGVVLVNGEDATVKRIYCTENTVTLMPQSTNPEYQPRIIDLEKTPVVILGKVVEARIIF